MVDAYLPVDNLVGYDYNILYLSKGEYILVFFVALLY